MRRTIPRVAGPAIRAWIEDPAMPHTVRYPTVSCDCAMTDRMSRWRQIILNLRDKRIVVTEEPDSSVDT